MHNEFIYGLNPCFEAIRAGRRKIIQAYLSISTKKNPRIIKLAKFLESRKIPLEWSEKGKLIQLANSKDNQGVVLKTSPYPYSSFEELIGSPKILLLDNIEDPHNVGAILRSAEVLGFNSVFMANKGVPEIYPSVVKVSAGATEFLKISKVMSANSYVKKAVEHGFKIIALDMKGETGISEIKSKIPEKFLLVIGGEDKSVGQFILNIADYVVRLEQHGKINSLNSSVAAGVAMFALSENQITKALD